jgi:hypothetical protein
MVPPLLVPDGPAYETTGGLVMAELGRIPTVGDTVEIPGWAITVLAMDGMRADRLRFVPKPESGSGAEDSSVADAEPSRQAGRSGDRGRSVTAAGRDAEGAE